jgi:hypothetical protein
MYALMSANEYVTHRYYQHNEVTITPHAMPAPARTAPEPPPPHPHLHPRTGGQTAYAHGVVRCALQVGKLEIYQTLRKMDKIPKLDGPVP